MTRKLGRRFKFGERLTCALTTYLSQTESDKLDKVLQKIKISRSDFFRNMVEKFIEDSELLEQ